MEPTDQTLMEDQALARQKFESGLECFRQGKVSDGLDHLREAHRLAPKSGDILGNMAWGCIAAGAGGEAVEYYEKLIQLNPGDPEAPVRRYQAMIIRDGYRPGYLKEMVKLARHPDLSGDIWHDLGRLAEEHGDSRTATAVFTEGLKRFPDNTRLILRGMERKRQSGRRLVRLAISALRFERVFRLLLKSATFRRLLRESTDSPSDYLYTSLMDFYRAGSTEIQFPQSPVEQLPETFARHMEDCQCPWWKWFLERILHKNASGMRLVDVGCGPGFIGHHFA